MSDIKLNSDSVNDLFLYDPCSGEVTRKKSVSSYKKGDVIRSLDSKGYLRVGINKKRYRLHRVIWLMVYKEWPVHCIDHINGIKTDNRLCNCGARKTKRKRRRFGKSWRV